MIKIYWVSCYKENRETKLIIQGLENNPRVELVDNETESDFVFFFYYIAKYKEHYTQTFPREKTVLIDYHDNPNWYCQVPCFAYFKRSWVNNINKGDYTARQAIEHPSNMYPLTMAIMDEFIIDEDMKRDIMLSCTLRKKERRGHIDRIRILNLLEKMDIKEKTQIGQFNKGNMLRFNDWDMKDYFRHLKRSRIVVTCNPSRHEGDHRTWEALANGALVFVDRTLTPLTHPLINYVHCIFYELSDIGLRNLRDKIFYFMDHPAEAEIIAKAGHEFAMKYHRTTNRIDEILEMIT